MSFLKRKTAASPAQSALEKPDSKKGAAAAGKGKKARGPRKVTLTRPTLFVLTIGDDGAILIQLRKGNVEGRWFAPDAANDHKEVFSRAMKEVDAPLLILLDTSDQSYVMHSLPPVNKMALGSIMKRRLNREFPSTEMKYARLFGREEGKKDWSCQIIAAEQTEAVQAWLDWALSIPNSIAGIRLVPLEMERLSNTLYASTVPAGGHEWQYLFSHHKVSGFRQVILRQGRMVFTRIGQPLQGPSEVIAGLIEQEISSTMEYLKRLGLRDSGHLHMELIASQDIIPLVDAQRATLKSLSVHTPHQAAEILGLQGATQANDRFGDMVMATAIARMRKPSATFTTKAIRATASLHKTAKMLRAAAICIALGGLGFSGMQAYTYWDTHAAIERLAQQKALVDADVGKTAGELKHLKNASTLIGLGQTYQALLRKAITPTATLARVAAALPSLNAQLSFSLVEWKSEPAATPEAQSKQSAAFKTSFTPPPNTEDEAVQASVDAFVARVKEALPMLDVAIADLKGVKTAQDAVKLDFSGAPAAEEASPRTVTFTLTFTHPKATPAAGGAP